jgi:hypothetical protein
MQIARVCEQPREDSLSVLRQRSGFASVLDAGVEKEARMSCLDAGVFIRLAC